MNKKIIKDAKFVIPFQPTCLSYVIKSNNISKNKTASLKIQPCGHI